MKILIVHQFYLSPGEPGGSRFNEFARLWRDAGHEVTVIAGSVNYTTGRRADAPRGVAVRRCEDGVTVWRCHVPETYSRSYVGRMWAFFGFTLSACIAAMRAARPDVVIATSPPLTAVIPGFVAARCRLRPVPWVFEMRDLWPESAITTGVIGRTSVLARILFALERWACRRASMVNVLTPAFADDLKGRGLVTDEKLCFVPNGADVDAFKNVSGAADVRRELGWGTRFVALYAGAHGRANALQQLVDAAHELRDRPDILIVSVGDGPERERLEADARARGFSNVQFLGPLAKERMPAVIGAADAGLAVLQNNPTFRTVYPNKVFDYMACAKPTVLAIDGVARSLACDEARAALFAEPENGRAIAAAIRRLADSPDDARLLGDSGRRWVVANAARPALADRYLSILGDLTRKPAHSFYCARGKRLFDILAAAAALILLAPVMIAVALVVRRSMGSPVLFRQQRPGRDGVPFTILKFRTMQNGDADVRSDATRLTRVGAWLRALSLDELPELFNVLTGDMSLVGPRPLLMQYLDRYTIEQARRHDVMPGITGWAQVHGRNALCWEDKFRLDVWYVDHCSLGLDLRILMCTVWKTLRRDGIAEPGQATAREFMGSVQS